MSLSYSPELLAASPNDRGYFERREELYQALRAHGVAPARDLADELSWDIREVTAKLVSLRKDGLVYLDGGEWYDSWEEE